jgi:hypothetical protein
MSNPATHSRVAGVQVALHAEADLWHCCSLWRGPALVRDVLQNRMRSKRHAITVQTSGISDSRWTRWTSCTAEPSAAASATSLVSAVAGTYGGTRAFRLRGPSEKRALGLKASLAIAHTAERGPRAPSRTTQLKPLSSSAASACNATLLEAAMLMLDLNPFMNIDPRGCAAWCAIATSNIGTNQAYSDFMAWRTPCDFITLFKPAASAWA